MELEMLIKFISTVIPIIFVLVTMTVLLRKVRQKSADSNTIDFELEFEEKLESFERRVAEIRSGVAQSSNPNPLLDTIEDKNLYFDSFNLKANETRRENWSLSINTLKDDLAEELKSEATNIGNRTNASQPSDASVSATNEQCSKSGSSLYARLRSRESLRQAIVSAEILGKPKGFST
ncbi:hypothetical protein FIM02_00800 [SAR202 cluster bacterium AD-802-E10_MRT_200m]|nr:hypothetical protein [SAR202 cluster bacterium AD-802-E10_MRT_200m]